MFLQNLTDSSTIYETISARTFADSQIQNCILDGTAIRGAGWNSVHMRDSNANDVQFTDSQFVSSNISRSSLMNTSFTGCRWEQLAFSGVTLIKTHWAGIRSNRSSVVQCTMQRCSITDSIFTNALFSDFEGIFASAENDIFYAARFEITCGGGMNGFSGAELKNCLFYGCTFSGFPLRGASLVNCAFIHCSGEITDDCESSAVYGVPRICPPPPGTAIAYREQAQNILTTYRTHNL
jgi:hypothetical protein